MPTISSELISADTLQIGRACDAFAEGDLLLPVAGSDIAVQANADVWSTSTLNTGMTALCIILLIIFLRRLITVMPHILTGLLRYKKLVSLEDNMRLSRERDSVATICIPTIMISVSRLDIIHADFLMELTPGMKTLAIMVMIAGFILLRSLLILCFPERKFRNDSCRISNKAGYDFLIVTTVCYLLLVLLGSFSQGCFDFAHKASYYVTGFLWGLYLIRKTQIMDTIDGQFTAFLYLCTVEIIPAGLLVASIVYL